MQPPPPGRGPAALPWVLLQAGLLVAVACVAVAVDRLPGLAQRAGLLAIVAGATAAVAVVRWPAAAPAGRSAVPPAAVAALAVAVAVAWALRGLPAMASAVPLGYDYGFYKEAFDAYAGGDLPLRSQPPWMALQFEPGLPTLHAVLAGVAGLSADHHLRYLHPALAALAAGFAFVVARGYAGTRAGLVAAGLTAASALQVEAHAYLYEKNIVALGLLAVALFLLHRRAWLASGLLLGAVGAWHRPTLLLAAVGLAVAVLADPALRPQWRGWSRTAALALALFLPVWLAMPETFFGTGLAVAEQSTQAFADPASGAASGTFFEVGEALVLMAPYVPLALAAAAASWRWPAWRVPIAIGLLGALYVAFDLPLNRRFLLMVDAVALVVAGAALAPLAGRRGSAVAVASLVLAAAVTLGSLADPPTPHRFMTEAQWAELDELDGLPANATLVADNLRSPYVLASSGHRTFGPGLFDDPHDRAAWGRFWAGIEGEELRAFMAPYGAAAYVVQVDEPGPDWGSASVRAPAFTLVHDGELRVWRYEGAGTGADADVGSSEAASEAAGAEASP